MSSDAVPAQGLGDLGFDQKAEAILASSPLLASADAYSTYTGVYGLPGDNGGDAGGTVSSGGSDHLVLGPVSDAQANEEVIGGFVANVIGEGGPGIDLRTASIDDLRSYIHDYSVLGQDHSDVPLLQGTTVTPSAADIAAAEGGGDSGGVDPAFAASDWSLATAGPGVGGMDGFGQSMGFGMSSNLLLPGSYQRGAQSIDENSDKVSPMPYTYVSAGIGAFNLANAGVYGVAKTGAYGLSFTDKSAFTAMLLADGGRITAGLSSASIHMEMKIGDDARSSSYIFDLGKYATGIEVAGKIGGAVGVGVEAVTMDTSDVGDWGHLVLNSALTFLPWKYEALGPYGLAFAAVDIPVSFYKYTPKYGSEAGSVQSGWRALFYHQVDTQMDADNEVRAQLKTPAPNPDTVELMHTLDHM